MRVLVVPSWYPSELSPTAGVFIQQQVRAIAPLADVAVLHIDPGTRAFGPKVTQEDGATVVRAGIEARGLRARYFGYRDTGREAARSLVADWGTPDVIHVQALWPAGLIGRDLSKQFGAPMVVTEHSEEYLSESTRRLVRTPGMVPFVLAPLARHAAATITVSRFLGERLTELGLARDPVVIPNVVPETATAPRSSSAISVILHVSIMGPAKDLPSLVAAAVALRERRNDFELRLVGDGECREALQRQVADAGAGDYIRLPGVIAPSDLGGQFAASSFAVVSSTHETFSVVAAEALMAGRPVLSTRCGGPEEFISPAVGRLVDVGDVSALVDGLDWMLDHSDEFDPVTLHDYAHQRFAPQVVGERIVDVYRSVLNA